MLRSVSGWICFVWYDPTMKGFPKALVALFLGVGTLGACSEEETKKTGQEQPTDGGTGDAAEGGAGASGSSAAGAGGTAGIAGGGGAGTGGVAGSAGAGGAGAGGVAGSAGAGGSGSGLTCMPGEVRDFAAQRCRQCSGAGAGGAAGASSGDPYLPVMGCNKLLTTPPTYDDSTRLLTVTLDYPLEIVSVQYDLTLQYLDAAGAEGSEGTGWQTLAPTDNQLSFDLAPLIVSSGAVDVTGVSLVLEYTDACGRISRFDENLCDPQLFIDATTTPLTAFCEPRGC